jgi:hypothetical protein
MAIQTSNCRENNAGKKIQTTNFLESLSEIKALAVELIFLFLHPVIQR